ncbi:hypothetical protein DFP72DRAFT_1080804 [Ephemerocybe angulata]|uniref:Uncharacterized protein n=1 Tax=Ephemerocybe angulata TaxID=980116 RepID=A0A8H6HBG6_9AGAR|nr:hypothetical protein DFP72DRAFT_1080804 [Tulosesus angulatus]
MSLLPKEVANATQEMYMLGGRFPVPEIFLGEPSFEEIFFDRVDVQTPESIHRHRRPRHPTVHLSSSSDLETREYIADISTRDLLSEFSDRLKDCGMGRYYSSNAACQNRGCKAQSPTLLKTRPHISAYRMDIDDLG